MRGAVEMQTGFFSYVSTEKRVPPDHPLRRIKAMADVCLKSLEPSFRTMYSEIGRPSIPPEHLLKAQLLQALYTVRSDRLFCEQLEFNILFRWFLDMSMDAKGFVPTVFTKNRDRLLEHEVAQQFFDAVVGFAEGEQLLSDEHFTVDGTLIEAWASMKSFQRKGKRKTKDPDDPGNPSVDFRGEKRKNDTHESQTDPEARLARKGAGKEAKLAFSAHVLMENRNGLCVQFRTKAATGTAEPEAALELLERHSDIHDRARTLGADKGYHQKGFIAALRKAGVAPHVAEIKNRRTPGLDGRTTRQPGYSISQRLRKRVEEIFGWGKTIGGLRKARFVGILHNNAFGLMVMSAFNLMRLARLVPA